MWKVQYYLTCYWCLITLSVHAQPANVPAFPGAEGFGTATPGGRGGVVLVVTNLDDHGPGSLRAALQAEGPRTVVFATGGIINLETQIQITSPFVTVAGQTAPGSGICLRGHGIAVQTHDVVIRYLRIRPGDIDFGSPNRWDQVDALSFGAANTEVFNVVVDHCSLSWAVDEIVGMWHQVHDITIQYCILSEALHHSQHPKGPHGMGMLIGKNATNISLHHNLLASNTWRNPMINGRSLVDFRNNVIYNFGALGTHIDRSSSVDSIRLNYVNNYIKSGPNSDDSRPLVVNERAQDHVKIYLAGNQIWPRPPLKDNWEMTGVEQDRGDRLALSRTHRRSAPFAHPPVSTQSAAEAYRRVLGGAGATLPVRDPVDKKILNDVRHRRGGIISSKNGPYEWPPYAAGIPFRDDDGDGMPTHWETQHGLDPDDRADYRGDRDRDGYTNIEEYLNHADAAGLAARQVNSPLAASVSTSSALHLDQNYPNPFVNSTHLAFSLDSSAHTTLRLFDSTGKMVNELINDFLYEGAYEIIVATDHLRPGLYNFVMVSYDQQQSVRALKQGERTRP